jgi:hypothetical protein
METDVESFFAIGKCRDMVDIVRMGDGTFGSLVFLVGTEGEQGKRMRRTRHNRAMK